jgi:hypothetical protein
MNRYPLRVEARRDQVLSRWLWLVKWLLLIPHYLVLLVLWTGLIVLTVMAYLAVLITGRYPAAIRSYNVGVLRWSWRVGYYGYEALGTDRYPPFTLADVPGYPARLHFAGDAQPPRWLPLVAWLLAIPHLIVLGALNGAGSRTFVVNGDTRTYAPLSVTLAALLVAAVALLFTGRYPNGLYRLLVGAARWNLRVLAYLILLPRRYPPLRLDQGDSEPDAGPDDPPGTPVAADPPGTPVPGEARRTSAAGPITALIAGVLLLLPGAGLGVGGGTLLALDNARDSSGYVTSPAFHLVSSTAAVTAENLTITDAGQWARSLGDVGGLRVTASSTSGRPIFVGVASQAAVDQWLGDTAHDQLVGLSSGRAHYDRADGVLRGVPRPGDQTFWLAETTGRAGATLRWNLADGNYAVVVANADGSPGVTADVRGAAQIPHLAGLGGTMLGVGIGLILLAVALIVVGGTGLGRRHSDPPPAGPGPTGPQPLLASPVGTGS